MKKVSVQTVTDKLIYGFREFVWLWLAMGFALLFGASANAQTTATNAVSLIEDNIVNARDTFVPLAIGALVLFIGIAAGVKFWKRIFSK